MNLHTTPLKEGEVIICDGCEEQVKYPDTYTLVYDWENGEPVGHYCDDCRAKRTDEHGEWKKEE